MAEQGRSEPARTENARTADAGPPQERSTREPMGNERPDYDTRQEQIREERLSMGPLAEGEEATPRAADMLGEEPPVDPLDPA